MTEGNYYPPAPPASQPPRKPSLWQRFKRWPLIARIGTGIGAGLVAVFALVMGIGIIAAIADPDGFDEIRERQAQEREERAAEQEAEAEREAEEERLAEEEAEREAAEAEAEEEAAAAEAEAEAEREAEEQRQAEEEEAAAEEAQLAAAEEDTDEQAKVPDVIGQPGDEARDALEADGFEVDFQAEDGTVWSLANWVVDTSEPAAGEMADEGAEVVVNVVRPEEDEDQEESADEVAEQRQAEREELLATDPLGYIEQEGPSGARDVEVYEFEGTVYISYTQEVVLGDGEKPLARGAYDYIQEAWEAWQPEWERLEIQATDPDAGLLWHNAGFSAGSVEHIATENIVIYETLNLRDTGETHFYRR